MRTDLKPSLHSRSSSDSEGRDKPKCRICFDGVVDDNDPLIRPCSCTGSMRFTHKLCLQKWRMRSSNSKAAWRCEVCNTKYMTTTTSHLKRVYYFILLPGLESLFYSCCISYVIGYFFGPRHDATRAEKASSSPPFTPTRQEAISGSEVQQNSHKTSITPGVMGRFMGTFPLKRNTAEIISNGSVNKSFLERGNARTWRSMFRNSKHWKRLFAGQYIVSVNGYISTELGIALGLGQWQFMLDLVLFSKFPQLVCWLFDKIIFNYAPILERPIQVLLAGRIFFDSARLARMIYDILLVESYIPNYLFQISEVRDLDEVEAHKRKVYL